MKREKIYSRYEGEKEELSPKEQVTLFNGYKKKARKHLILAMVLLFGVWILVKLGKLLGFATVTTFAAMYEKTGVIDALFHVYNSFVSAKIDDYNSSMYYENPSYLLECYLENRVIE